MLLKKDKMRKMKNKYDKYDIGDDEVYMLGQNRNDNKKRIPWWLWIIIGVVVLATSIFLVVHFMGKAKNDDSDVWYNNTDTRLPSSIIISDTLMDGIHLRIFTPYNTVPTLHVGTLDTSDAEIVFATLAADLGYENGKIIGAFVCEGEPRSWGGGRKLGYCAIIGGNITLGVSESSPLFEQAIEQGGYFFRQYPAVDNGEMVKNNPKNASFRRALCMLNGKVCVVATTDNRVLMNDFSSALAKLGVENAIFLVGGTADGWYRNGDGTLYRLGEEYIKGDTNINYIVFRAQ